MNKKNWREKVFIFTMVGIFLTIILNILAMVLYAGGTSDNPNAPGYSFWINTLSDLSMARAWSGKDNTSSRMLSLLNLFVVGIITILFGAAFRYFFIESVKKISQAGAFAVIIQGCLNLVLSFDINAVINIIGFLLMLIVGILGAIFYSIAIFRTKEYPNRYGIFYLVDGLNSIIWILIILMVSVIGVYPAAVEKILWCTTYTCYFIVSYGAWKEIKS